MKKIITCFLNERTEICIFCKKCNACKNFLFLYEQFEDYYFRILDKKHNYAIMQLFLLFFTLNN